MISWILSLVFGFNMNEMSASARLQSKMRFSIPLNLFYFVISLYQLFLIILGSFNGGWVSQYADAYQFLQIDLGKVTKVTRIATQGRADAGWWSKTYTLEYSEEVGATFKPYKNGQVFVAARAVYCLRSNWINYLLWLAS